MVAGGQQGTLPASTHPFLHGGVSIKCVLLWVGGWDVCVSPREGRGCGMCQAGIQECNKNHLEGQWVPPSAAFGSWTTQDITSLQGVWQGS